jgi:hypothetical protein
MRTVEFNKLINTRGGAKMKTYKNRYILVSVVVAALLFTSALCSAKPIPSPPSNLEAKPKSSSQINLTWTDNSTNETGFKIERGTAAGGPFSNIATTGSNIAAYNDTAGLSACTTYYYRVRAYNATGNSAYSSTAFATTMPTGTVSEKIECLIRQYYLQILDREPDTAGLNFWRNEINHILTLGIYVGEGFQALGRFHFTSPEYVGLNKTDSAFVTDLYETFLQRSPDQAGHDFWVGQLSCLTRGMLITQFAYSDEFKVYMTGTFGADTTRPENNLLNDFYRGFMNRFPDDAGFNAYLAQMRDAQCTGADAVRELSYTIALMFVQSEEYTARNRGNFEYVEDLYNGILRRGADCDGFLYWVNILNGLMSREDVLQYQTDSPEFQGRVDAVIAAGCLPSGVCNQCDQINLTIKVPEKLQNPPKVLMAYLYSAENWIFPPNRPPDGGTSDNYIIDPQIDVDKPLQITVPACTYYRDKCLSGDYYLYVALMQNQVLPPTVQAGDYWWGMQEVQPEPLTLGTGTQQVIDKQIMLVPYALSPIPSISLPVTGQTTCYDTSGNVIACAGTGQDGDIKAGVAWPDPRFTPNADTTITDNLTGLIWAPDANLMKTRDPGWDNDSTAGDGAVIWQHALDYVTKLNSESYLGHQNWRLPNVNELESLVNAEQANNVTWLNSKGFTNFAPTSYWSSTTCSYNTDYAWVVYMYDGYINPDLKSSPIYYVWPVSAGECGSPSDSVICLPKTGQTTSYYNGDDGALERGIAWPNPRFTNPDGTIPVSGDVIVDQLTGLMWTKNANTGGYMTWQQALDYVKSLNIGGYTGWRLPNRKELRSIVDYSRYNSALPQGNPFTNVQIGSYWSSTTEASRTGIAWFVDMYSAYLGIDYKSSNICTWPVRSVTTD